MDRIKCCPNCGTNNSASQLFCQICGTDISRVHVELVDALDLLEHSEDEENCITDVAPEYLKFCRYCGKLLNPSLSTCQGCGYELMSTDMVATENKIPNTYTSGIDSCGVSEYSLDIIYKEKTIKSLNLPLGLSAFGRIHLDEYENSLNIFPYISELHCLFFITSNKKVFSDVSLNGILVNDAAITGEQPILDGLVIKTCDNALTLNFKKT